MNDYTVKEVAELLRVKQHTVLGWIESKELHADDVRSATSTRPRWRIPKAALDAFRERRANPTKRTRQRKRRPQVKQFF